MKLVGTGNRDDIELDPVKAFRRGRALDRWLNARDETPRGVTRGTADALAAQTEARMVLAARRVERQR